MHFFVFFVLLFNILTVYSKIWIPEYDNEKTFYEPYDYVNENDLPNFEIFGKDYNWIGIAGASLSDQNTSYVAFSGTRKNNDSSFDSVYTKKSGIIVLCSSKLNSLNTGLDFVMDCKVLEERHLKKDNSKYFGSNVRCVKTGKDTIGFVYCDPLWVDTKNTSEPSGKCKLSLVKNLLSINNLEFNICDTYKKCLGGFSVDIDQNLNLIFGVPFDNSTILLKNAQTSKMSDGITFKGKFFNFGYSVAFSENGNHFISSPVSDEHYPFILASDGDKILPKNIKTQNYGGFGISIDTVHVGNGIYGVIIGAPYQTKQKLTNVGAVSLACKGHEIDMVYGEEAYDYFGYSVARLGDIDFDSSEEFVVGAPNLNLEKPGKIYIYKTTVDCKISKVPLQVHQSKIQGFGIAISRGFDINSNKMPDFFVTALNYKKPLLFKMPNREKVTCSWVEQDKGTIYSKNQEFNIKIIFNNRNIDNYNNYFFQVAVDYLNKEDQRFELITSSLFTKNYIITVKTLMDVQDMDFRMNPLRVAIRGIRLCKLNGTCYSSRVSNIDWLNCDQVVKLPQNLCGGVKCLSDLNLMVYPDQKGSIIYYGEQKDYMRQIVIIINNGGPDSTQPIYLSIDSKADLEVTNVKCNFTCKTKLTTAEQNIKIIINEKVEKREQNLDDLKIIVDVLYKKLDNVTSSSSINFYIWGNNDDENLVNNNYTVTYTILFRPNLILSSGKTKGIIIDSRIKPPYLEYNKRIGVSDLGTELQYSYIIENRGPALKNVDFKFYFPYQTQSGNYILYIMNELIREGSVQSALPSISNRTNVVEYCKISKKMVNPLKLNVVDKSGTINRIKRAVSDNSLVNNFTTNGLILEDKKLTNSTSTASITLIKCNESSKPFGLPICGEITCRLNYVPMNSEFIFNFRTWLFTKTFFDANIADLTVESSLQSNLGDLIEGISVFNNMKMVGPFSVSQNVLFDKIKIIESKQIPLWPIIVAIIIGILLLVIIIVIAYYCGFFKRKRLRKERKKIRDQARKDQDFNDNEPLTAKS